MVSLDFSENEHKHLVELNETAIKDFMNNTTISEINKQNLIVRIENAIKGNVQKQGGLNMRGRYTYTIHKVLRMFKFEVGDTEKRGGTITEKLQELVSEFKRIQDKNKVFLQLYNAGKNNRVFQELFNYYDLGERKRERERERESERERERERVLERKRELERELERKREREREQFKKHNMDLMVLYIDDTYSTNIELTRLNDRLINTILATCINIDLLNVVNKIIKITHNNDHGYSKEDIVTIFGTFQKMFAQYINFRKMVDKFKKYNILELHNRNPDDFRGDFLYNLSYLLKNNVTVVEIANKYDTPYVDHRYEEHRTLFQNLKRICTLHDTVDNKLYEILYEIFEQTEKWNHEQIKSLILQDNDYAPSYDIIKKYSI